MKKLNMDDYTEVEWSLVHVILELGLNRARQIMNDVAREERIEVQRNKEEK